METIQRTIDNQWRELDGLIIKVLTERNKVAKDPRSELNASLKLTQCSEALQEAINELRRASQCLT
jgi:hypothetical protein